MTISHSEPAEEQTNPRLDVRFPRHPSGGEAETSNPFDDMNPQNAPIYQQEEIDRAEFRMDAAREQRERFGVNVTREVLIAKTVFLALSKAEWAERLPFITAFVEGEPVYRLGFESGRQFWTRCGHAEGFHAPAHHFSLSPPECQIRHESESHWVL